MIKKILVLILLSFSLVPVSFADVQKKVKLDNDKHFKEMIEAPCYNIFLELIDVEDNGNFKVKVSLENLQESYGLSIFERAYDERTLKQMRPKFKYDENFPGAKGKRVLDACSDLDNRIHLEPSQKIVLMTLNGKDGIKIEKVRLPIYTYEHKYKKILFVKRFEYRLKQKEVVELEIDVDLKPDETYIQVTKECDEILEEFEGIFFCTNTKHKPSLEQQQSEFQSKIDALISKIDSIIESNGWFSSEKRYKMYDQQRDRLRSINLKDKEGDCGEHKVVDVHKCKYCNLSFQQIYHKLDDIYQEIHSNNPSDRSVLKSKYIMDVKAMYNCAKKRPNWKRSDFKDKITRVYNKINQY